MPSSRVYVDREQWMHTQHMALVALWSRLKHYPFATWDFDKFCNIAYAMSSKQVHEFCLDGDGDDCSASGE